MCYFSSISWYAVKSHIPSILKPNCHSKNQWQQADTTPQMANYKEEKVKSCHYKKAVCSFFNFGCWPTIIF